MDTMSNFLKHYWTSIVAYIVYLLLYFNQTDAEQNFRSSVNHIGKGESTALGEAVMYGELLMFSVGTGGVIVCMLIAAIYKDKRKHFLILGFLWAIPATWYFTTLLN
jgi:hypothetical protein